MLYHVHGGIKMSVNNITREEFQLYRQAQEKERLVDRIRSSLDTDYGLAALSGVVAAIGAATAVSC